MTMRRQADAVQGAGTGKLWARSKIASLEGKLYSGTSEAEVNKGIEAVALEHHLVSSRTSLVAIDTNATRPDGKDVTTVKVPLNLPDGWVYDKVFGQQPKPQHAMKAPSGIYGYDAHASGLQRNFAALPAPPMAALRQDPTAAMPIDTAPDPAQVPSATTLPSEAETQGAAAQTDISVLPSIEDSVQPAAKATKASQAKPVALFVLLLVILSAVTLLWWRYHRRDYASPRRIGRRI